MNTRSLKFLNQIKRSLLFKGISIVLSFLLVRFMLEYLGADKYGIWVIILGFMNWIVFFDLGIANGLKNKVSEAIVNNNQIAMKMYISTAYVLLIIFCFFVYIIFHFLSDFINWQFIFNTDLLSNIEFNSILKYTIFFVLLNFILSIILAIYNAFQESSYTVFQQLIFQLLLLCCVLILMYCYRSNIKCLAIAYGISLVLSNLLLSIMFYSRRSFLLPRISNFSKKEVRPILSLGLKFFYLQLLIMLILRTDNIIVAQLLTLNDVTSYDIIYKYFSVILVFHTLINTPLWAIYTEAYMKNDYKWISNTLKKMIIVICGYVCIGFILYLLKDFLLELWLGRTNIGSSMNYIFMFIMIIFIVIQTTLAIFTNGINKTKNQSITLTIGMILNIPLSIFFVKYCGMGLNGVILATIASLSIFCITGTFQVYREITKMKLIKGNQNVRE